MMKPDSFPHFERVCRSHQPKFETVFKVQHVLGPFLSPGYLNKREVGIDLREILLVLFLIKIKDASVMTDGD